MKSSLSILDCKYNNDEYCDRLPFIYECVPNCERGETVLNPELYDNNRNNQMIKLDNSPCCNMEIGYTSEDNRLKNARTGNIPLVLNEPPLDFQVNPKDIYTQKCEDWTTGYTSYENMRKGQIEYYIDQKLAPPFTAPVFQNNAQVTGRIFVDPMNGIKPTYTRIPTKKRNCLCTNVCRCEYLGGLSWIEDSNEQREMIIARQMAVPNQKKWEARYPIG